jgi:uncharacterized iron-regulated membrane protein
MGGRMTKQQWRKTWFQVHQWIGLGLAILIIPLSLSGAALVWDEGLDRLLHPSRFAVSGEQVLNPAAYEAAARVSLGREDRIVSIAKLEVGPVLVVASPPAKPGAAPRRGPPQRTSVYLDPPTARVLGVASNGSGPIRFLHVLHGSLFVPGWGRTIVGLIGVAMMLSSFTGLWLWWPTVGRAARGLRWKRHRNTDTNLHYLAGFWIALPLFVLSLTGAWISFPALFGGGAPRGRPPMAEPLQRTGLGVDRAAQRAGGWSKITWPTTKSADWTVELPGKRSVKVADDTGALAVVAQTEQRRGITGLMRRIHDGTGMGWLWQFIIFVGGLLPALLAVTGVIMWIRARTWRADLARRQATRA